MKTSAISKARRQRGIALLLTLGILALLLIISMSFAFNAQSERQSASIYGDQVRTRLMDESQLQRVVSFIRDQLSGGAYPANPSVDAFLAVTPASGYLAPPWDSGNRWQGRSVSIFNVYNSSPSLDTPNARGRAIDSALAVSFNGKAFIPDTNDAVTDLDDHAGWDYVMGFKPLVDGSKGNEQLNGRQTYIVIDETGKLDPNTTVLAGIDESDLTSGSNANRRTGVNATEPNLLKAFASGTVPGVADLNKLATDSGVAKQWLSWRHLINQNVFTSDDQRQDAYSALFPYSYDIQAFRSSGVDYHRFNLARTDWDSFDYTQLYSNAPSVFWQAGTDSQVATNGGDTGGTSGIAYLQSGYTAASATDKIRIQQLAANIKDYCDSDSIATNDYSGTGSGGTVNFVGVDAAPYVNEVVVTAIRDDTSGSDSVYVDLEVELVNLYTGSMPCDVFAYLQFTLAQPSATTYSLTYKFNSQSVTDGYTAQTFNVPAKSYQSIKCTNPWTGEGVGGQMITVNDVVIVVVPSGTAEASYTKSDILDYVHLATDSTQGALPANTTRYAVRNATDPRCNTFDTGTEWATWDGFSVLDNSTPDAVNGNFPVTLVGPNDGDPEAVTGINDPVSDISTAYIRNAPMQSLWELGFIQRGEPWQTVNLKAYNGGGTFSSTYSLGDAGLLDEVKIGTETRSNHMGTFNPNSRYVLAWRAMLSNIYVGSAVSDFSGGTAIDTWNGGNLDALITDVTNGILAANGNWSNRGQLGTVAALTSTGDASQNTDAKQEEIIGKLANLLTVRSTYYSVVCTAEAVRDFGAMPAGSVTNMQSTYDYPLEFFEYTGAAASTPMYARRLGQQKTLAIIYRDALSNEVRVVREEPINE